MKSPVDSFVQALGEEALLRKTARSTTALQSLREQKAALAEILETVEFWATFSDHKDDELRSAVKLLGASLRLINKSLANQSLRT